MSNTVKNALVAKDVRLQLRCKAMYMSGFYTTEQILKETGVKRGTFYKWVKELNWVQERQKYQQEMAKEVYGKLKKHMSTMYSEVDGVVEYMLNKVVTDLDRMIKAGENLQDLESAMALAMRLLTMKTTLIQFLQQSLGGDLPNLDPTALVLPTSKRFNDHQKVLVGNIQQELEEDAGIAGIPDEDPGDGEGKEQLDNEEDNLTPEEE